MDLSIVVPIYNEIENLEPLCERLHEVIGGTGWSYELVLVDDGSTDGSGDVLRRLHGESSQVKVLSFRRNFGQTAALAAGFEYAGGNVIVSMDADLQNDPSDIPKLVAKLEEGYDLVNGWRMDRQDPYLHRLLPSRIANKLISLTTRVKLHDYGCTLKAFRPDVAKGLKLYGEMHRFIPALAGDMGARITEIPVPHHARTSGASKYGLGRTWWVVLDLLTVKFLSSYATRPSHFFGLIGLISFLLGGGITVALGLQRSFFKVQLADRPILLFAILLFVTGIQLMTTGLIAELLSRTYHESQKKPIYQLKDVLD